jgi:Ala-tRNA(Pro) deacylase
MSIPATVKSFLDDRSIAYAVVPHPHSGSSMDTAAVAHVPGDRLAKAVIVNHDGAYVMVVVPSDYHVRLGLLHRHLGGDLGLATEPELAGLFPDCEVGAIPPLGAAYGLRTLIDPKLSKEPEVYLESGDHESLILVSGEVFRGLMADAEALDMTEHV